jgi:hypothetical protein
MPVAMPSDSRLPKGGLDGTLRSDGRRVVDHCSAVARSGGQKKNGRPRPDDRKVLNGIFFVLRTGTSWRDLPERDGPYTTVYNRFNRWAKVDIWVRIPEALAAKSQQSLQLIDSSIIPSFALTNTPPA